MALSTKARSWILGIVLAASLVAAFAPTESAERDSAPHRPMTTFTPPPVAPLDTSQDAPVIVISRPLSTEPAGNPFSTSSWVPPPPPPARPPPPLPPTPPSLPYAYLGRIDDAGKTAVLLGQADNSHAIRVGDTIGSVWRIEAATDQAVEFIYLPLNARKTLAIGNSQ